MEPLLAAAAALLLFVGLVWLFEVYLWLRGHVPPYNVVKARTCLVASTLQVVSSCFWLRCFGGTSKVRCRGLLGAEVSMALLQLCTSMLSIIIALVMHRVEGSAKLLATRFTAQGMRLTSADKAVFVVCALALGTCAVVACASASSRPCPHSHSQWARSPSPLAASESLDSPDAEESPAPGTGWPLFLPAFLLVDCAAAVVTLHGAHFICSVNESFECRESTSTSAASHALHSQADDELAKQRQRRERRRGRSRAPWRRVVIFFRAQGLLTLAGAIAALLPVLLPRGPQRAVADAETVTGVSADGPSARGPRTATAAVMVVCLCLVHVSYALRRVQLLSLWVGFDLRTATFKRRPQRSRLSGGLRRKVAAMLVLSEAVPHVTPLSAVSGGASGSTHSLN